MVIGQQVEPESILFSKSVRYGRRIRRDGDERAAVGFDPRQRFLQRPERCPAGGRAGAENEGDDHRTAVEKRAQVDIDSSGVDELEVGNHLTDLHGRDDHPTGAQPLGRVPQGSLGRQDPHRPRLSERELVILG